MANTEADRELSRCVAEAQRSLQRAVAVCSRVRGASSRPGRQDGDPAEMRRSKRLHRQADREPNPKKAGELRSQADQILRSLDSQKKKQALSQMEEAAVSSRRAEVYQRKLVRALSFLEGVGNGRLSPYSNDPDLVSEELKFPGWHNQTLFKGRRIEVLDGRIFVDGEEYGPLRPEGEVEGYGEEQ